MSKLNELFVDSINKAVTAADVMSDINAKPMAYASIAHAIAVYLQGDKTTTVVTAVENTNKEIKDDLKELQSKNEMVSNAINETINEEWTLPYDENGIPYLNDEDFSDPQKVLAYQNAMTPEMEAKKQEIINAQGQEILNETANEPVAAPVASAPAPAPTPAAPQQEKVVEFKQEHLDQLEAYKVAFDYYNNPTQLDNLYHNYTDGISSTLNDITPATIEAFLYFIQEELAKAKEALEGWKASWITKEGLDNLIADAYQAPGATIDEYVHDGNIFWFLEYVELYNANAWLNVYRTDVDANTLNEYVKQYFDDATLTIDNIDDTNVVGFIYFIQQSMSQTA